MYFRYNYNEKRGLSMGQRTYHNKLRRYQRLRQKQTEQQYEYLTERHIIRPAHPKYAVLNRFSHVANNVYNQGLYRARLV